MEIEKNSVSSARQIKDDDLVRIVNNGGKINVLFVGNSITRHAPKEEIGWMDDWGMAAASEEADYVHVTVKGMEKVYGKVNYATACCGDWEREYWNDENLSRWKEAKDFKPDILVIRIGENIWGIRDKLEETPLYPHYDAMINYFKAPNTKKVLVSDLFWSWETIDEPMKAVCKDRGYTQVTIGDIGAKDENKALGQFWHSGVAIHPNDLGMKRIAERILEKLL